MIKNKNKKLSSLELDLNQNYEKFLVLTIFIKKNNFQ